MKTQGKKAGDHTQEVLELVSSAHALEDGRAKVALLEQAVQLADAHQYDELGFEVRMALMQAATFGGAPDVLLVAFAWCLAQLDKNPDRFWAHDLLWQYKWVAENVVIFPHVTRQQIEELLVDMERRYRAAGSGLHPVHQTARKVFLELGDLPAAKKAHARTLKATVGWLSDCAACELDNQIAFYLETGRPAIALRKAEPIISGRLTCAEVPHRTYGRLVLPLLFAGQSEQAAEYLRRGTRLIRTNPSFLWYVAQHLLFLTVTDNLTAAARYLERHIVNGLTTHAPSWGFEFDCAAAFLFDRLAEQRKPPRIRLPADLALPEGVDQTDPAALRDHFAGAAWELAAAFDARNGNDGFARRLASLADLKKRSLPYPLS
jgi:hypothetical protein